MPFYEVINNLSLQKIKKLLDRDFPHSFAFGFIAGHRLTIPKKPSAPTKITPQNSNQGAGKLSIITN